MSLCVRIEEDINDFTVVIFQSVSTCFGNIAIKECVVRS